MSLLEKQQRFVHLIYLLLTFAWEHGYEVTFGDAYRDPRVFGEMGIRKGYGQASSYHKSRLAVDLNLYRDGEYLSRTEDHAPLGEFWESIGGSWGGRWHDGNHYSLGEGS